MLNNKNEMKDIIHKFLFKYAYQQWNIAIADIGKDLKPANVQWMKHDYTDRWFADPFILGESEDNYIVLVEEFLRDALKGRLARLTLSKEDFHLVKNETILDLDTHLSFPNFIDVNGIRCIYPESQASGMTYYYEYGELLQNSNVLFPHPVADPVIYQNGEKNYLLYTNDYECNDNKLQVAISDNPLSGYAHFQTIEFKDNVARRAGNVFSWGGRLISPAQISNNDYGEGVCLQELSFKKGEIELNEIVRLSPPTRAYPKGFHTYNVFEDKVIIDGYRYGSDLIHFVYFFIRKFL